MSLPVWGNLAKSQTDAEKIEEAIVRLITEHNEDETAHLGAGQSLQSHKAAEIIDHLAESIVEDKIGDGEISSRCITSNQIIGKDFRTSQDVGEDVDGIKFNGSGIEMWQSGEKKVDIPVSGKPTFKGNLSVDSISFLRDTLMGWFGATSNWSYSGTRGFLSTGIYLRTASSLNAVADIYCLDDFDALPAKNPFFDIKFSMSTSSLSNVLAFLLIGTPMIHGTGSGTGRLGFKIVDGVLYTLFENESTDYSEAVPGFTLVGGSDHRLSMDVKEDEYVRWYVDGILIREEPYTNVYELPQSSGVDFYIKTTDTSYKQINLRNCNVTADYEL
ncbi:MAG: hypothetical protein WC472_04630 [Candidatus Paceibacterota bacterium]